MINTAEGVGNVNARLNKHIIAVLIFFTVVFVSAVQAETLRFWTTEEQPDRLARQQALADTFKQASGIEVQVIPVTEKDLGTRATAALAANDLPDVIYHSLQYVLPWTEAGILDPDANNEVVEALDPDTFAPAALAMATTADGAAAIPVDGWTQLVLYRKDLFEEKGLQPPDSYAAITAAIEALHNPPEMYGFVAATKIDENFMSQVLEHVFLANGLTPVDDDGYKGFDEKKLGETLAFYKTLVKASPPGDLFWKQSREMYFAGKAAMIIWSPFILDELAGLRDSAPPTINDDPQSTELASKTGVITQLSGPSNPQGAAWADIRYLGITNDAETDLAIDFVKFSMDQGYMNTLSIAPEGKFPVRLGTSAEPQKFAEAWAALPVGVDRKKPLSELYDAKTITAITSGLNSANRWGVKEGQLSLASRIVNSQVINRYVREYTDDQRDLSESVKLINEELGKL